MLKMAMSPLSLSKVIIFFHVNSYTVLYTYMYVDTYVVVFFLPVDCSELGGKYPPSIKSAHVPTHEGQVFKAKVRADANFYAACYICVDYPGKSFLQCPDDS